MQYNILFAGLQFKLQLEHSIQITRNFMPFLCSGNIGTPDWIFHFCADELLENCSGTVVYTEQKCEEIIQKKDGSFLRVFTDYKDQTRYACAQINPIKKETVIFYRKEKERYFGNTGSCFFHTCWEQVLAQEGRLILHASLISTAYGGLLFSGPSGIGKSTQAALWEKWEGAKPINGDRPILYKDKDADEWLGCGSPYAGSSRCHIPESVPIRALVLLEQAELCRIQRLSFTKAFKRIYANCTMYSWNRSFVEQVLTLTEQLVMDVPVYILSCTPDQNAVQILKQKLEKEGI